MQSLQSAIRKAVCAITLAGLSPLVLGAGDTPEEAVFTSLDYNPEIQIRWHAFQSAGFDTREASGAYRPSIDLSGGTGVQDRQYDNRGDYHIDTAELTITQMLFDGFRTRSDVERLEKAQQVRLFELLGAIDSTALEAIQAYDDVILQRDLLDLVRDNYNTHMSIETQIRDQVGQGIGRGVDLDQVVGRVALTEANLLSQAANLHDVTARYLRVIGELPAEDPEPLDMRYDGLPSDINEMLYAAYQGNSIFHASIRNIDVSQSAVDLEKSDYWPRLELRARTGTYQNIGFFDERFDSDDFGNESRIELAFTYNLYRGGSDKAAVNSSLAKVDEAKSLRDQTCINLRQAVQIAYNDARRIEERLNSLRQHRDASDLVRDAYAEQFQIGQRTLLDVLDSENEYFQASSAVLAAEHELTIAHAQLLAATGKLLPALGIMSDELMFLGDEAYNAEIAVNPESACPAFGPTSFGLDDLVVASYSFDTDVLFETDLAVLTEEATGILNNMIAEIEEIEGTLNITIDAHADSSGAESWNIPLSQARARSVRDFLVLNSDRSDLIEVNGYGSSQPRTSNESVEGRRMNRRVEITARKPGQAKEILRYNSP